MLIIKEFLCSVFLKTGQRNYPSTEISKIVLIILPRCRLLKSSQNGDLEAHKPHAGWLQWLASRQSFPGKVTCNTTHRVHFTFGAAAVPESSACYHCTVTVLSCLQAVVVAVIRGEHHPVVAVERITTGVTWVPTNVKHVVGRFCLHYERTVLCVVPVVISTGLQVKSELVAAVQRQLTEQFVAEPVVASWVVESDFELLPRTVEEIGTVEVLLDQQRNASL